MLNNLLNNLLVKTKGRETTYTVPRTGTNASSPKFLVDTIAATPIESTAANHGKCWFQRECFL